MQGPIENGGNEANETDKVRSDSRLPVFTLTQNEITGCRLPHDHGGNPQLFKNLRKNNIDIY